jgi:hypothetical protein
VVRKCRQLLLHYDAQVAVEQDKKCMYLRVACNESQFASRLERRRRRPLRTAVAAAAAAARAAQCRWLRSHGTAAPTSSGFMEQVAQEKKLGNAAYGAGDWTAALRHYSAALQHCDGLQRPAGLHLLHGNRWAPPPPCFAH